MAWSIAVCFASLPVWALPTGAQIAAGSATINQIGNTLTVANTPGAIINWNAFSIGALEAVRFDQQNSLSSVLNRVTGSSASAILGSLSSNGRIFLINPNGILFGAGSRIDVNGLIASTLNLSDADFLAGKLDFTAGDTAGSIRNAGTLQASPGGNIYLIAPDIENSGIVRAPNGEVLLAAGRQVSLIDGGHPDIQVVVSAPEDRAVNLGDIAAGRVSVFGALLSQRGQVSADTVETDAAGRIVFRASKQLDVEAGSRTVANGSSGGSVVLQSAGDTYVKGTVEATGSKDTGGTIAALGNRVAVLDRAVLDASGEAGGGRILVGGDYQGKNAAVPNAQVTYFGPEATLKADAQKVGAGGTVIVWADDTARAYGSISARGGSQGGDGGFVETSGKRWLGFQAHVDTLAPNGKTGSLLLDPSDITIQAAGTTDLSPLAVMGMTTYVDLAPIGTAIMTTGDLVSALDNTNVTVSTSSSYNAPPLGGSITVTDPVTWTSTKQLVLEAANNININASITGQNGTLTLTAGNTINQEAQLNANSVSMSATGAININSTLTAATSLTLAAADITLNGGLSGDVVLNTTSGGITFNTAINTHSLTANSYGAINLNADITTTVGDLVLRNAYPVGNHTADDDFHFKASGSQTLTSAGNIELGYADNVIKGGATVNLNAAGDIYFNITSDYQGTFTGNWNAAADGTIHVQNGNIGGNTITLQGNDINLLAGANATGALSLTSTGASIDVQSDLTAGGGIVLVANGSSSDITVSNSQISAGNGLAMTAGRDIKLISTYVESPAKISATSGMISLMAGRDVVLDASGGSSDGGQALIHASGDVGITAGGDVTLTASGGQTIASIDSESGNVSVVATGDVSLAAYGSGTSGYAGIFADGGDVTVRGRSVAATANSDGSTGTVAEIYGYGNATVEATGGVAYGGVQIFALTGGSRAGIYIQGGGGAVDVQSQGGVTLSGSGGGYAFISAEGGVSESVSVVAHGGDITLSGSDCSGNECWGGAEIYAYVGSDGGGAVNVEAKAGGITIANASDNYYVGIDGENGTTVRASGNIAVTGNGGTYLPYIGWDGGTSIYGLSLTLDSAKIDDQSGDIHVEVDGNIGLLNASRMVAGGDIYLTLKGAESILSLADGSKIVSVYGIPIGGGECGQTGCTTYIDFPSRSSLADAVSIGGTAYVLGTAAVSDEGGGIYSGIYYGAPPTVAYSAASGEYGLVINNVPLCDSGWYCWDGGSTGDWSLFSNWTTLGGGYGTDPGSIDWANGKFKVGSGYSTVWDEYVSSDTISTLSNSGIVTIAYGGPVSIGDLTLTGGQLISSNALVASLTIGNTLSMDANSLISGFPSIVKSSGAMTLAGSIYYAGNLSLDSAGSIDGTATVQGVASLDLTAQGNIGPLNIITPVVTATSQAGSVTLLGHSSAAPHALAATVSAVNGTVSVSNYGALTLNSISAYGGVVSEAHSPLIVAGPVTSSGGTIALTSSGGDPLTISSSGTVTTSTGSVSLTSGSGGTIVIDGSVAAPVGVVSFAAGSAPSGTGSVTTSGGTTSGVALSTLSFTTTTLPPSTGTTVPTLDACVANPGLTGCSAVLPPLDACLVSPATPGCSAVLPTLASCISAPATPGCSTVLPTISACISDPTAAGCSIVLPTLASCISAPAMPGCSTVLPPISVCISNPTAAGCSAVLPTLATCTGAPATPGCAAVLPTISTCISNPTASGCTAVLPTVAACVANPAAAGCSAILPTLAACISAPNAPGCASVLPTLGTCVATPSAAGCSAVLPTLATCTSAPATAGCSAVLPSGNLPTDQQLACLVDPTACGGGTPSGDSGQGLIVQVQSGEQQVVLGTQTGQSDSGRPDLGLLQTLAGGGGGGGGGGGEAGGSSSGSSGQSSDDGEQEGQTPQQGNSQQGTPTPQTHRYCN